MYTKTKAMYTKTKAMTFIQVIRTLYLFVISQNKKKQSNLLKQGNKLIHTFCLSKGKMIK